MKFASKLVLTTLTDIALAAPGVSAQFKLPTTHNAQHKDLLAHQRPAGVSAKSLSYLEDLRKRESFQDNEIYTQFWNSEAVNPYKGVEIPATAKIDVSSYVAPVKGAVTSKYGYRPRFGRVHRGMDLRLNVGDTVVAAFDGKVRITKYEARGYGYYVVVRHDNGMETVYGHLSRFLVKPDQRVRAGQPIALGGNTGRSTGPHLHFETRYMGVDINPEAIIDFENFVPHRDEFVFDRAAHERSQHYAPAKKKWNKAKSKARKSRATASKKKKSRRSRR